MHHHCCFVDGKESASRILNIAIYKIQCELNVMRIAPMLLDDDVDYGNIES